MSEFVPARPTALYRLFGATEELLYIGVAFDPKVRFVQHRKAKWWHQATRHTLEWFPTRAEAEAAETAAIQSESPLYNITDHPINKPAPPKHYNRADSSHGMTAAKFRVLREFLGLTGDWLAAYLGVQPRTLRTWEQGKYSVPFGACLELEDLATKTSDYVREQAEHVRSSARTLLVVYRSDDALRAAHPKIPFPASWHRAAVKRVALEVPALRITYAPTPSEAGNA